MKILFLAPHLKISGGVRIILMYANLLAHKGHEATIYVRSNNKFRRRVANILQLKKPTWIKDFKPRILRIGDFTEAEIESAGHIISTTLGITDKMMNLPDSCGQKYYLIQHKEGMYHGNEEEEKRAFSYPIPKLVVSTWLKKIIEEEYRGQAELLLNPIDRDMFKPVEREKPTDEIRILLLHHTYDWKGTKEGVEIVQKLKKKYPKIKLVMFGVRSEQIEYPHDEYYYNLPQEKLAWLYSNSDIFLCPSWDEGSGLPNMEAMACRCAVVTYNNGGSWDYAIDNKTALVAERKNKQDLASKLERLVADREERKKIAMGGYNQVINMPTWEEQANRFESILKKYGK